ncbi:MAG: hypothetical protein JW754_02365 [Candidatus Aenigmarchaeota archaeon]|nr:hypothetical protein [Candidatus Aenigmarchaeota archaeon]
MSLESLRKGQIVLSSYPVISDDAGYWMKSGETGKIILVRRQKDSEMTDAHFNELISTYSGETLAEEDRYFVPCVMNDENVQFYEASLLAPPDMVDIDLSRGMVIPDLRFCSALGPYGHPTGFILDSQYRGFNDFFSPKNQMIAENTERNVLFHGEFQNEAKNWEQKPVVYVKRFLEAGIPLSRQNGDMIKMILDREKDFWWNLEI